MLTFEYKLYEVLCPENKRRTSIQMNRIVIKVFLLFIIIPLVQPPAPALWSSPPASSSSCSIIIIFLNSSWIYESFPFHSIIIISLTRYCLNIHNTNLYSKSVQQQQQHWLDWINLLTYISKLFSSTFYLKTSFLSLTYLLSFLLLLLFICFKLKSSLNWLLNCFISFFL